jgi:hypothetical protein
LNQLSITQDLTEEHESKSKINQNAQTRRHIIHKTFDLTWWRNMQIGSFCGPGMQMSSLFGQSTDTAAKGLQSGSKAPQLHWQPSPVPYCSRLHVHSVGISGSLLMLSSEPTALGRTPRARYK